MALRVNVSPFPCREWFHAYIVILMLAINAKGAVPDTHRLCGTHCHRSPPRLMDPHHPESQA